MKRLLKDFEPGERAVVADIVLLILRRDGNMVLAQQAGTVLRERHHLRTPASVPATTLRIVERHEGRKAA